MEDKVRKWSRSTQDFADYDYIHKLSPSDRAYLLDFTDAYYTGAINAVSASWSPSAVATAERDNSRRVQTSRLSAAACAQSGASEDWHLLFCADKSERYTSEQSEIIDVLTMMTTAAGVAAKALGCTARGACFAAAVQPWLNKNNHLASLAQQAADGLAGVLIISASQLLAATALASTGRTAENRKSRADVSLYVALTNTYERVLLKTIRKLVHKKGSK